MSLHEESTTTYRVQGLPSNCTYEDARNLIGAAVGLGLDDRSSIKVHSLAKSVLAQNETTATISSNRLYTVLPKASSSSRWTFKLPKSLAHTKDTTGGTEEISLDTTFAGFTPLNSFNDENEHLLEYDLSTLLFPCSGTSSYQLATAASLFLD
jgi:hypothetical protein